MEQRPPFLDERIADYCLYCNSFPDSREHVPARVLLDEPYPENLPVVGACRTCNSGYSLDEEYLACLVECVVHGTTDTSKLRRPKIRRLLDSRPALASRLAQARDTSPHGVQWRIEKERVTRVVEKLARGHALFELGEAFLTESPSVNFVPLHVLEPKVRDAFEAPIHVSVWPEVGSRAFIDAAESASSVSPLHDWIDVQESRYRYLAGLADGGVVVRMVFSEYLAAEVIWN